MKLWQQWSFMTVQTQWSKNMSAIITDTFNYDDINRVLDLDEAVACGE